MNDGALLPLPIFWARNGLTKTQDHYLHRLGRGVEIFWIGSKPMVTPEAEDKWRKEMAANPVKGSLRELVKAAAKAASAEAA